MVKIWKNCEIDFISPVIDSNTDTLLIRAKFENKNRDLIAGNFTKLKFQICL